MPRTKKGILKRLRSREPNPLLDRREFARRLAQSATPEILKHLREASQDERIVAQILNRDASGLEFLLRAYGGRVSRRLERDFARYYHAWIEDALWIAADRVWRDIQEYDFDQGSLCGWFYRIAYSEALKLIKQSKAPQNQLAAQGVDLESQGLAIGHSEAAVHRSIERASREHNEYLEALDECIAMLSPIKQAIIETDLREGGGEDANTAELAKACNSTPNTIRAARSQARRQIRDHMQSKGFFLDEPRRSCDEEKTDARGGA